MANFNAPIPDTPDDERYTRRRRDDLDPDFEPDVDRDDEDIDPDSAEADIDRDDFTDEP